MGLKPDIRLATKVDTNNRLTVSEFIALVAGMRRDDDVLLYDTGFSIGEIPGNGYEFDAVLTAADNSSDIVPMMFSSNVGDFIFHNTNDINCFALILSKTGGGVLTGTLASIKGAGLTLRTFSITLGVRRYYRLTRTPDKTRITLFVYSDSDRLVEVLSRTIDSIATDVYSKPYYMTNQKTGTSGAASGDMSNPHFTWILVAAIPPHAFESVL